MAIFCKDSDWVYIIIYSTQEQKNIQGVHFIIIKKLFCLFFLLLLENIDCKFSLELSHGGDSNKYQQSLFKSKNQRTNGPVNAHLILWPSKAQNIQNLEKIW